MNSSPDEPNRAVAGDAAPSRRALVQWVLIVRAVVVLALGCTLLVSGALHPVLGNLLATFWLAGALLTLRWSRQHRETSGSRLAMAGGLVAVGAAVVMLSRFIIDGWISVNATLAVLGTTAVIIGCLRLLGAFRDEAADHPRLTSRIALGVSEIVLGIVWIAVDDVSQTFAVAAGLWAVVGGVIMLLDALDLRRAGPDPSAGAGTRGADSG